MVIDIKKMVISQHNNKNTKLCAQKRKGNITVRVVISNKNVAVLKVNTDFYIITH